MPTENLYRNTICNNFQQETPKRPIKCEFTETVGNPHYRILLTIKCNKVSIYATMQISQN